MTGEAFWIDYDYDREMASDGVSRYAAYLRSRRARFEEAFSEYADGNLSSARAQFALVAWAVATGPIMSPGYVRCHRRVLSTELRRSAWDGSLTASVELVADRPASLQRLRGWRDWPTTGYGESVRFDQPDPAESDLAGGPYLTTSVHLAFSLDARVHELLRGTDLDTSDSGDIEAAATDAVAVLVDVLNAVLAGPLAELEGEGW